MSDLKKIAGTIIAYGFCCNPGTIAGCLLQYRKRTGNYSGFWEYYKAQLEELKNGYFGNPIENTAALYDGGVQVINDAFGSAKNAVLNPISMTLAAACIIGGVWIYKRI